MASPPPSSIRPHSHNCGPAAGLRQTFVSFQHDDEDDIGNVDSGDEDDENDSDVFDSDANDDEDDLRPPAPAAAAARPSPEKLSFEISLTTFYSFFLLLQTLMRKV